MKTKPKEFIITDQCFFEEDGGGKDYNPDLKRKPHAITLVDPETGTIRLLKSGSRIVITNERE